MASGKRLVELVRPVEARQRVRVHGNDVGGAAAGHGLPEYPDHARAELRADRGATRVDAGVLRDHLQDVHAALENARSARVDGQGLSAKVRGRGRVCLAALRVCAAHRAIGSGCCVGCASVGARVEALPARALRAAIERAHGAADRAVELGHGRRSYLVTRGAVLCARRTTQRACTQHRWAAARKGARQEPTRERLARANQKSMAWRDPLVHQTAPRSCQLAAAPSLSSRFVDVDSREPVRHVVPHGRERRRWSVCGTTKVAGQRTRSARAHAVYGARASVPQSRGCDRALASLVPGMKRELSPSADLAGRLRPGRWDVCRAETHGAPFTPGPGGR